MKPTSTTRSQVSLLTLTHRWLEAYPDLALAAEDEALRLLKAHGAQPRDPHQVYWHLFDNAQSSSVTFSGWRHSGPPVQTLTLPQLVLQRFSPAWQERLDELDQLSGFYTADASQALFDERTEVPLLPSQLSADFWAGGFAERYQARLNAFWDAHTLDFIALSRASALVALGQARDRGALNDGQLGTLRQALANGLPNEYSAMALAHERPPAEGLRLTTLSLGGMQARDLLRIHTPQGSQYLYMPNAPEAIQAFDSNAALLAWLRRQAATPSGMAALRAHFDPADRHIEDTLMRLREPTLHPEWLSGEPIPATDDPFAWLAGRAAAEMREHADHALTRNDYLRKEAAIAFLSTLGQLAGQLAPLGWPIALAAVASASVAMGLDIDKAVRARSVEERRAAIGAAIGEGLMALFSLPFLAAGEVRDWPWETFEDAEPAVSPPMLPPSPISRWPLNSVGMIEQADLDLLFAVQAIEREGPAEALVHGLPTTTQFDRLPAMMDEPCLRVFGSAEGALSYAQAWFDGPFHLFRIQARGLRVVSLRHNLRLNRINTLALLGQEDRPLPASELADLAGGAWLEHEAHVALGGLSPSRLRLLSPMARQPWSPAAIRVLRGVRCQRLGSGSTPLYLIMVDDALRPVRFDPLSDSWRTADGAAFRYDDAAQAFAPTAAAEAIQPADPVIEASTAELGMPATFPWRIPTLSQEGRVPLPRMLHSVWLGGRLPTRFVSNVINNARRAALGDQPFEYHLYLNIDDPLDQSLTLSDLAMAPDNLKIHLLEDTPFFKAFEGTPSYEQYRAATQGTGINYASAVDVLRYRLLHYQGGVYMDIDDTIYPGSVAGANFPDQDWETTPGRLLLNGLVNAPRLGLQCEFNTSNFAALPGTPVLEEISQESYARFLANRDVYFQRPREHVDSREAVTHYAQRINHVTGPGVFNDVLLRSSPELNQFRAVTRIASELHLPAQEMAALYKELRRHTRVYCPLAWRIQIGSTSSWLHTR